MMFVKKELGGKIKIIAEYSIEHSDEVKWYKVNCFFLFYSYIYVQAQNEFKIDYLHLIILTIIQAAFRCEAEANPPPYPNSYKWYIDDKEILGQSRQYFEIYNVTRSHHDKQIKCSVENELGTAMGLRSIQVKCRFFLN